MAHLMTATTRGIGSSHLDSWLAVLETCSSLQRCHLLVLLGLLLGFFVFHPALLLQTFLQSFLLLWIERVDNLDFATNTNWLIKFES